MTYKRTQVYLDPEHHRALHEEARRRGTSLTGLLREILGLWVGRGVRSSKGFEALIGLIDQGEDTDVAGLGREYKRAAFEDRLRRKLGETPRGRR